MKIKNKKEYDLLQEQAHEIENKVISYRNIFAEIEKILHDIDYIASYDIHAAKYLISKLPNYINTNYNKYETTDKEEVQRYLLRSLEKEHEDLESIYKYDSERAKEIENQIWEPIRRELK